MVYVFRSMRKKEPLKVNRQLMSNGFIFRPGYTYYVVTTDNPKNNRNRLIVAAIGVEDGWVRQMAVAPSYKWTDVLSYGLRAVRLEAKALRISMKLRPQHVYAIVTAGWYFQKYSEKQWHFLRSIPEPVKSSQKFKKETTPYVVGEKVVNLWEFMKTDREYRRFKNWKPRVDILAWNLYDAIPFGERFSISIPPMEADEYTLFHHCVSEMDYEFRRSITLRAADFYPFSKWLDENGVKATKRIKKFMYDKYKYKLSDAVIEKLNQYYRRIGAMSSSVEVEFSRTIDWRQGGFGDSGSCWLYPESNNYNHNCHFAAALNSCGYGLALKIYRDGKGIGRAFGSVEDGHLFLFNFKSGNLNISSQALFEEIAKILGLSYAKPSLYVQSDDISGYRDAYIEAPYACISRNPVVEHRLRWYKEGEKDMRHYVPHKSTI